MRAVAFALAVQAGPVRERDNAFVIVGHMAFAVLFAASLVCALFGW